MSRQSTYSAVILGFAVCLLSCELLTESGGVDPVEVRVNFLNTENGTSESQPEITKITLSLSSLIMTELEDDLFYLRPSDSVVTFNSDNWERLIVEDYVSRGIFDKLEVNLRHPMTGDTPNSLMIEGEYDGESFTLEYPDAVNIVFELTPPLSLEEKADPLTKIDITFDTDMWFLAGQNQYLNPSDSSTSATILANIKRSLGIEYEVSEDDSDCKGNSCNDNGNKGDQGRDKSGTVSISDSTAFESDALIAFRYTLSETLSDTVWLTYTTKANSAKAGEDFEATSGKLAILPGNSVGFIEVVLLNDDIHENDEKFTLEISSVDGANLDNSKSRATGTIIDDDEGGNGGGNGGGHTDSLSVAVADAEALEDTGIMIFEVSLSDPATEEVSVSYHTAGKSAKSPDDFVETTGEIIFEAGEQFSFVQVEIVADTLDENDEVFTLQLEAPSNGLVLSKTGSRANGIILDDDESGKGGGNGGGGNGGGNGGGAADNPIASVADAEAMEDTGLLTFEISLSKAATEALSVDYLTSDKSAKSPEDYIEAFGTIHFAAGESTKSINISLVADSVKEGDEVFSFILDSPSEGLSLSNNASRANGTILNDDEGSQGGGGNGGGGNGGGNGGGGKNNHNRTASIFDTQTNEDTGLMIFIVKLDSAATQPLTLNFSTKDKTASSPEDYVASSGTIHFNTGDEEFQIMVDLVPDTLVEKDEVFTVELSNPSEGLTISNQNSRANGTILNDDEGSKGGGGNGGGGNGGGNGGGGQANKVSITASEAFEDAGPVIFQVSLSEPAAAALSVQYSTQSGTADEGIDYTGQMGTLFFSPGDKNLSIEVDLIADTTVENDETFWIELDAPSEGLELVNGQSRVKGTILNDDEGSKGGGGNGGGGNGGGGQANKVSITASEAFEDAGPIIFQVNLSEPAAGALSVQYSTQSGTADEGIDYNGKNGTLLFAIGDQSLSITVDLIADTTVENDETFWVELDAPSEGLELVNGQSRVKGTILNDDEGNKGGGGNGGGSGGTANKVTITTSQAFEDDGSMFFQVGLSEPAASALSVNFSTQSGTADEGIDYTAQTGTLHFSEGVQHLVIEIDLIADTTVENDETFWVELDAPSEGLELVNGQSRVKGTILNDDEGNKGGGGNGGGPSGTSIVVSIDDATASEGDEFITFNVNLSASSTDTVFVDFATSSKTAKAGSDYVESSGRIAIQPGSTIYHINIPLIDDNKSEKDEQFTITLSLPFEGVSLDNKAKTATGVIIDDDSANSKLRMRTY